MAAGHEPEAPTGGLDRVAAGLRGGDLHGYDFRAERELAVLIPDTDRDAIHLGLHDILDMVAAKVLADGGVESEQPGQRVLILPATPAALHIA